MSARIVLVGDYNAEVTAHQAIPRALALGAGEETLDVRWLPTDAEEGDALSVVGAADGIWCVPASPYASTGGALRAIRYAREHNVPFLGTCGGCQHALMEFAMHVRGIAAAHAEIDPSAPHPLIASLACSLVEEDGEVRLIAGTRLREIYGMDVTTERYHCRYGLARDHETSLFGRDLIVSARDSDGEVRAIELNGRAFFFCTLFQPERAALRNEIHPLTHAFVTAAIEHSATREDSAATANVS